MNPFKDLTNDIVYIENSQGKRSQQFKAAISKNEVTIFDVNVDAEKGYKLIQSLPNNKEKLFTIIDVEYNPGLSGIPAFYKLEVEKTSVLPKTRKQPSNTTINIHDSSSIQIGDHNVQNITNSITQLIEEIDKSDKTSEEKLEAKSIIKDLLYNPTVAAILGGSASGLLGLLT